MPAHTTPYYTPEEKRSILDRIYFEMALGKSMLQVLREHPELPARANIHEWILNGGKEEQDKYGKAMEMRQEVLFDELREIAANPHIMESETTTSAADGTTVQTTRQDALGHRKLLVDTLKWSLARMNPRKYGDRVQTEDITEKPKTLVIKQAKK